ncbi:MAG: exosortase/archaeosortase family protein [Planctomycetota bacterium]
MLPSYAVRSWKAVLVLAVFSSILLEWAEYTGSVSRINYCLLVPVLAAVLAWSVIRDWSPLAPSDLTGVQWGYCCLGFSGIMLTIGSLASIFTISIAGFPIAVLGLVGIFWGKEGIFRLRYALLMFFAMVPVPLPLLDRLTPGMVRATGAAAVAMVSPFDPEATWIGADLTYRGWTLFVAEACSGSGTLLVLGTLTLFMAGLFRMSTKAIIITLILVAPITIFINGLRIAVMAWVLDGFGPAAVTGAGHEIVGQLVVIAGAASLALVIDKVSSRRGPK